MAYRGARKSQHSKSLCCYQSALQRRQLVDPLGVFIKKQEKKNLSQNSITNTWLIQLRGQRIKGLNQWTHFICNLNVRHSSSFGLFSLTTEIDWNSEEKAVSDNKQKYNSPTQAIEFFADVNDDRNSMKSLIGEKLNFSRARIATFSSLYIFFIFLDSSIDCWPCKLLCSGELQEHFFLLCFKKRNAN